MIRSALAIVGGALAVVACGGGEPDTVRLLAYDSFPTEPDNPIVIALDEFTDDTGIDVEIITSQDTGTMLSAAALTAGNPEGDVMWGIDNTFLSRAIDAEIFEPYAATNVEQLPDEMRALVPNHEATPVDFGDVCLNYDIATLDREGIDPPSGFGDLTRPEYAGKLVVMNPGSSSPGLAFLIATIATYGEAGWEQYWRDLRANDVAVVDSWTSAYYAEFSFAGGDRPIVVSYGSSPPYEVLFATDPTSTAPTGVIESTCFRQTEFAGVLRGTKAPDNARKLVDFLISERFQREIALNLFVFPVNPTVELQDEFANFAAIPSEPISVDPALIETNRTDWIERWNAAVLR